MFEARKTAPTDKSDANNPLAYRVWTSDTAYLEDKEPWKCVAAFRYLQECLDYVSYCQEALVDVVVQSPAGCRVVKASDRRAVAKVDSTPAV